MESWCSMIWNRYLLYLLWIPWKSTINISWLVVWNMFYFPYIGNNNPNWRSYFSEGLKPPPSYLIISVCCTLQIVQKHDVSTTIETSLSDLRSIEVKDASPDDVAFFVMDKITLRRAEWSSGRFLFKENWGNSFRTSTTFNLLHQIDILWSNMSFPEGFKIKLVVNQKNMSPQISMGNFCSVRFSPGRWKTPWWRSCSWVLMPLWMQAHRAMRAPDGGYVGWKCRKHHS